MSHAVRKLFALVGIGAVSLNAHRALAQVGTAPRCPVRGSAQWLATRPSPLDSATVSIDSGIAKLCYSRPHARGRVVFGALVAYGRAWRTGANEPTTLYLTVPATVAGASLAAGRYVLLTVPDRDRWAVVFHTAEGTEASEMYRTLKRVAVAWAEASQAADTVEQLTVRPAPATEPPGFILAWETTRVRLPVAPWPQDE